MLTKAESLEGRWVEEDRGFETPCWIWQRGKTTAGYSEVCSEGRVQYGHRVSYEVSVGPIPAGLVIDHLCCQRDCINPAHLEPVTNIENLRRAGIAKLQEEDVRQIRALVATHTQREVAQRYEIHQVLVSMIVTRKRWGWVT